jgi:tetratricopeptide (TPR) repeat protein
MSGGISIASPNPATLEERIWTADDETLPSLEREGVRLVQIDPGSAYYHFLLSHTYLRMFANDQQDVESLRAASELATQSLELAPDQEFGYVAMAEVLEALGQSNKAMAILHEGRSRATGWRLQFSQARLSADRSNAEDTAKALQAALNFEGSLRRIIAPYLVIVTESRFSSPPMVLSALEEWASQFPGSGFDEAIAAWQSERGHYAEAHEIYQSLHKGSTDHKELLFSDSVISYRKLGKTKEGIAGLTALKNRLRSDPEFLSTSNKKFPSMIEAHLGAAYLRKGNFRAAHDAFLTALDMAGDRPTMIEFLFNEYKALRAEKHLISLLQEISEIGPGQGIVHAYMAEALSDRLGQQAAAVDAYRRAIVLEPTRSEYHNGLGLAFYRQSDLNAALIEFTRATEIDPGDASARYNEACALALLGRKDEALYSLREAVQLEPRLSEQARVDKDFGSISKLVGFQEIIAAEASDEPAGATASLD